MHSSLIEYFRFDDERTGVLTGGKRYILTHKNDPVREVAVPLHQNELLRDLKNCFRYKNGPTNEEKWKTIRQLSNSLKSLFLNVEAENHKNCQFDVVLNASELALLPFELILDEQDMPYFANKDKKIIFTRRFRHFYQQAQFSWPYKPRVLFAYSHGGSTEVPFQDHHFALKKALNKWFGKNPSKVLQVLDNPSFESFASIIRENNLNKTPFTHIHILGHGKLILDEEEPQEFEYGILFGNNKDDVTPTLSIKNLFESLDQKPFMVNFMICDGANFANAMKPEKNPVQVTHKAGVPIVLGSQYPLSMDGSSLITKHLYTALFKGWDIREILYEIRCALFQKKDEHHDWISLVSYVRLPEGYEEYLYKVALEWHMQDLKWLKSQTDELLIQEKFVEDDYISNIAKLKQFIDSLNAILGKITGQARYEQECLENMGLLGSAYKRLSELHHILDQKKRATEAAGKQEQRNLLLTSLNFYKQACDKNLSHHWSAVQYLSLDLVLNGEIKDPDYWYAARKAAYNAIESGGDVWAYGSLMELMLLSRNTESHQAQCLEALQNLIATSNAINDVFPLESTWYQLNRYKSWWTKPNGFEINNIYLIADAGLLNALISALELRIASMKASS